MVVVWCNPRLQRISTRWRLRVVVMSQLMCVIKNLSRKAKELGLRLCILGVATLCHCFMIKTAATLLLRRMQILFSFFSKKCRRFLTSLLALCFLVSCGKLLRVAVMLSVL